MSLTNKLDFLPQMSAVSDKLKISNKERQTKMETKGYKVRVINNDKTETVYVYAPHPGRWAYLNEFYGKAVQEGKIFTCFIEMV